MPARSRSRSRSVSRNRPRSFSADAVTRKPSISEGETRPSEISVRRVRGNNYGTTIVGGQARVHLGDVNATVSNVYRVTHSHVHSHGISTQASPHLSDTARHVASAVTGGLIVLAGSSLSSARSGRLSIASATASENNKRTTLEKRTMLKEVCVPETPSFATTNFASQPSQTGPALVKEYNEWLQRKPLITVRESQLKAMLAPDPNNLQKDPINEWLNDTMQNFWLFRIYDKERRLRAVSKLADNCMSALTCPPVLDEIKGRES